MPRPMHLPNLCSGCVHFQRQESRDDDDGIARCAAYPDGIPFSFWTGGLAHIDPDVEGGLAFELLEGYEHVVDTFTAFWLEPVDEGATEPANQGPVNA